MKSMERFFAFAFAAFACVFGCSAETGGNGNENAAMENESVTFGKSYFRGFLVDNVLHSKSEGDIHFSLYVPSDYDAGGNYALFVTLPGWEGLYFQGVAENLRQEDFGPESIKYNSKMIVAAPQLGDWGMKSAREAVALVEYLLDAYKIDRKKVYIEGYSGGGAFCLVKVGRRLRKTCVGANSALHRNRRERFLLRLELRKKNVFYFARDLRKAGTFTKSD